MEHFSTIGYGLELREKGKRETWTFKNKSLLRILGLGLSATQGMECPRLIRATFIDTVVMCILGVSA